MVAPPPVSPEHAHAALRVCPALVSLAHAHKWLLLFHSRPPLSPASLAGLSLSRALDTPITDSCLYRTRPRTAATVSLTRQRSSHLPFSFAWVRHLPRPRRLWSPSHAPKRPLLFRSRAVLSRICLSHTRFSRPRLSCAHFSHPRPSPARARANCPAPELWSLSHAPSNGRRSFVQLQVSTFGSAPTFAFVPRCRVVQ